MTKLSDKKKRWIKNEAKDFSFLLPSLVIFIIIIIIPLISGIRYTFTDWNGTVSYTHLTLPTIYSV